MTRPVPLTERQRAKKQGETAARAAVRDAALEDAAKICDRARESFEGKPDCLSQRNVAWRLAHDIRLLKRKP